MDVIPLETTPIFSVFCSTIFNNNVTCTL
jgi:hypothetical protein